MQLHGRVGGSMRVPQGVAHPPKRTGALAIVSRQGPLDVRRGLRVG